VTYVAGIDSSTKTGVAILTMDQHGTDIVKLEATYLVKQNEFTGLTRAGMIANEVIKILRGWPVELVVIENYSFGSKFNMAMLVEIGTITRYFVKQEGYTLMTVSPSTMKKFVAGVGTAQKNLILKEAHKKWGFDFTDDNECDAACLGVMGLAYLGHYKPPNKVMAEAAAKLIVCN
jgi:Holliday junction resolvasome RuvABC endonuclease subunit